LLPPKQTLEQIWRLAAGNTHIAALIESIEAYGGRIIFRMWKRRLPPFTRLSGFALYSFTHHVQIRTDPESAQPSSHIGIPQLLISPEPFNPAQLLDILLPSFVRCLSE
jgi:hypothetical protein